MKLTPLLAFYAITSGLAQEPEHQLRLLFFGDSLTAGYGIDPDQAFPSEIERRFQASSLGVKVIAAGLSGETSAGGLRRIDWVMREPIDVLVLELGANDGLRGIPPASTADNLKRIIKKVRSKNEAVTIILAGMKVPPNLGEDYSEAFDRIFTEIAEEMDVLLVPFILEGVAGESDLNIEDGIHPTPEGHRIIADTLWPVLEPMIRKRLLQP